MSLRTTILLYLASLATGDECTVDRILGAGDAVKVHVTGGSVKVVATGSGCGTAGGAAVCNGVTSLQTKNGFEIVKNDDGHTLKIVKVVTEQGQCKVLPNPTTKVLIVGDSLIGNPSGPFVQGFGYNICQAVQPATCQYITKGGLALYPGEKTGVQTLGSYVSKELQGRSNYDEVFISVGNEMTTSVMNKETKLTAGDAVRKLVAGVVGTLNASSSATATLFYTSASNRLATLIPNPFLALHTDHGYYVFLMNAQDSEHVAEMRRGAEAVSPMPTPPPSSTLNHAAFFVLLSIFGGILFCINTFSSSYGVDLFKSCRQGEEPIDLSSMNQTEQERAVDIELAE